VFESLVQHFLSRLVCLLVGGYNQEVKGEKEVIKIYAYEDIISKYLSGYDFPYSVQT